MTGTRPADILRHFEQTGAEAPGNAELLARFAKNRDQAAFAVLVRRHGPMVLAVCQRITNHPQDAEDAFQAVFLVLARKAAALGRPELLGNWLFGVAVRVAQKARRSAARRRAREVQAVDIPEPAAPPADPSADVGPVLHEELARLPAWYREAVVLCDLRGVPRAEAAKLLGIPEGTLSSRLAGGRKKLAERLARRGVALSVAAIPTALGEARGAAAVPDSLVSKTCGLVADWAAGAAVPGPVLRLADGGFPVRNVMLLGLFTTVLTAAGVVFAARSDDPKVSDPLKQTDPVAKAEPTAILVTEQKGDEKAKGFTTHPKLRKAIDLPIHKVAQIVWSPDGKGLAFRDEWVPEGKTPDKWMNEALYYSGLLTDQPSGQKIALPLVGTLVGFTPDGKHLITDRREYHLLSGLHQLQFLEERVLPNFPNDRRFQPVRTIDLDSDQTHSYAFAPDGKTFRTVSYDGSRPGVFAKLEVREVSTETGKTLKTLLRIDGEWQGYALAENGKRIVTYDSAKDRVMLWDVDRAAKSWTFDLPADKEAAVAQVTARDIPPTFHFSPDGRKLVCLRLQGTILLDAEKGKPLPPLENGDRLMGTASFTTDGRLLAVSGQRLIRQPRDPGLSGPKRSEPSTCTGVTILGVWDTDTGKNLKTWNQAASASFSPVAPVLAVLEQNGEGGTRLGFWDFTARPDERPKPEKPAEEKPTRDIRKPRADGIAYLKKQQNEQGTWEGATLNVIADMDGGMTGLVALALLEAGFPANDPAVSKAVEYLSKLPAKKTYVVSLQTQVLARVDAKKHAAVIQRNVDWLLNTAVRKGKELAGWSYPANSVADGSNTHFAVIALHAADKAGARVSAAIWRDIREMYARTAIKDGWTYTFEAGAGQPSHSMTGAALCGLAIAGKHIGGKPATDRITTDGWKAFLERKGSPTKSEGYMLLVTAELGRLLGKQTFKEGNREIAWYTTGAEKLVKDQKPDGSWELGKGLDADPVYSTAAALYFLGPPKK